MARIDGQIWIDKNSPHRLKYYVAGEEYSVEVSANYEIPEASVANIKKGAVVKFTGAGTLDLAQFPDDIENVLGVVSGLADVPDPNNPSIIHHTASVSRSGYLLLDTPANILLSSDLDVTQNGWGSTAGVGIGAPVYWFIGRTTISSGEYSYEEPSSHPGFLTLTTPSGYKWNVTTPADNTMNVDYDNLPQVGTVAGYTLSGDTITALQIHLNFAKFDTSLEWSWPYLHYTHSPATEGDCGKITHGNNLTARHGLFSNAASTKIRNYCNIIALDETGNEYVVNTGVVNTYTGTDRKTVIQLSTPDDLYYRVTGTINYNFDKGHTGS